MEQSNSVTLSHQRLYRPIILGPHSVPSKTASSYYPWPLLRPIKDCILLLSLVLTLSLKECIVLLSLVLTPSHQRLYRPIILGPYSVPSKTVSSCYPWSLLCPIKDCMVLLSLVLTLSHQRLYRPIILRPYLTAGKSSTR